MRRSLGAGRQPRRPRLGIGRAWVFWVLTLLFGLGGTLPLFLHVRERRLGAHAQAA